VADVQVLIEVVGKRWMDPQAVQASFAVGALAAVPTLRLDRSFPAVRVRPDPRHAGQLDAADDDVFLIRARVDGDQIHAIQARPGVLRVLPDNQISAFQVGMVPPPDLALADVADSTPCAPCDCNASETGSTGDIAAVARYLGSDRVWEAGYRGSGIVIGVCDSGVRRSAVPALIDGWSPPGGTPWGDDGAAPHGTMCATDALGQCPEAKILDIGILKSQASGGSGDPTSGLISDAIAAYDWVLERYRREGTPQILTNSWGIYQESWGPEYASDINHPFTRKVVELIDAGILVCFAAGNCGEVCPSGNCGSDVGPGRSIWGAYGHPRVITVGAGTINDAWIGYTSQGPAALDAKKPDVCAPSHYTGFTRNDNGTSAACPTLAGVLGLLRQANQGLRQDAAKDLLQRTARGLCQPDWDPNSGYGMIQAYDAYLAIKDGAGVGTACGTLFRGQIPASGSVRWKTEGWSADRQVAWSMVPSTTGGGQPQVRWRVQVERSPDGQITYWITAQNLTSESIEVEGRYCQLAGS